MDASTIVSIVISIFSIAISIFLGVTALKISSKSDSNLEGIKTEINALSGHFMRRLEQEQANYHEVTKLVVADKVHRGEWSSKEADDFKERVDEVLHEMQQGVGLDASSILSNQSKVGKE